MRDEVYFALSDLVGARLSESEAAKAVVIVSNRMFGRSFKEAQPIEENQTYDKDTLPDKRSLIDKLNKIEAQGLAAAALEITSAKKKDSAIVHQSDSTTKNFLGKFQVSGVQLNGHLIPFPTIPVSGETKDELAEQVALGLQFLTAASGIDAADIYEEVDAHMTDSTSHNKRPRSKYCKTFQP